MRITVVGTTGSGKTTLAGRLAAALDLPHFELDAINWQPGWVSLNDTDQPEFIRRIEAAIGQPAWPNCWWRSWPRRAAEDSQRAKLAGARCRRAFLRMRAASPSFRAAIRAVRRGVSALVSVTFHPAASVT
jgi:hypothetical protein